MDRCPVCKKLCKTPLQIAVPCEHEACPKCVKSAKKSCIVCQSAVERYVTSATLERFMHPGDFLEATDAHDTIARSRQRLIERLDPEAYRERAREYFGTDRTYNIIYADPPWRYGPEGARGGTSRHYQTMSDAELADMPVLGLAREDAALLLWCTDAMMEKGLRLIEAWGFVYLKFYRFWIKENKHERTIFHGPGNFSRGNIEFVMLGIRGEIKRYEQKDFCMPKPLLSPVQEHSRKPEAMAESIVDVFGDLPRIELFARRQKFGWDTWGNEQDHIELPQACSADHVLYKHLQDENSEIGYRLARRLALEPSVRESVEQVARDIDRTESKRKTRIRTNTPVIYELFGERLAQKDSDAYLPAPSAKRKKH